MSALQQRLIRKRQTALRRIYRQKLRAHEEARRQVPEQLEQSLIAGLLTSLPSSSPSQSGSLVEHLVALKTDSLYVAPGTSETTRPPANHGRTAEQYHRQGAEDSPAPDAPVLVHARPDRNSDRDIGERIKAETLLSGWSNPWTAWSRQNARAKHRRK